MLEIQIDSTLMKAVITGTSRGLSMAGIEPIPVGASCLSSAPHSLSVIVGVAGRSAGTVVMNMTEPLMLKLTTEFLAEPQKELSEENIDAIMEIGNIVAGSIKEALHGTDFELNLSSNSPRWNLYSFDSYRDPQPPRPSNYFNLEFLQTRSDSVECRLTSVMELPKLDFSLAAVIKTAQETLFFATHHAAAKADFHARESFTIAR